MFDLDEYEFHMNSKAIKKPSAFRCYRRKATVLYLGQELEDPSRDRVP
jgi:hypothetical protein